MKPQVFSFFSGAGFLDLGFETSGFEVAAANEIHKPFADAYSDARIGMGINEARFGVDLSSIDTYFTSRKLTQLKGQVSEVSREGGVVGFIGGPPCPDFSVAGKNAGGTGENGRLSTSYIDLIIKVKPQFFLFENVKGLWRTEKHRDFYESLKRDLVRAGYSLSERLINSIEYGAPQDRDRIILLGVLGASKGFDVSPQQWLKRCSYNREEVFAMPWPTAETPRKNRPIPDGIAPELTVGFWFDKNKVTDHPNAQDSFKPRAGLERFKMTLEGDVSRKSYKRLHRRRYSPTAAYGNNEVHIHPWENRRISVAEALAIQSLPSAFALPPSMTLSNMFKAIGNGVPFLAAQGLAKTVADVIRKEQK
jgi:DNA (cytosine-5)-methyltransferase 1